MSGPAEPDGSGTGDIVAEKAAGTQDVASAFLFNPNKAAEGSQLLAACGVETDAADPGVIIATTDATDAADAFVAAIAKHRHFARETDPPRV